MVELPGRGLRILAEAWVAPAWVIFDEIAGECRLLNLKQRWGDLQIQVFGDEIHLVVVRGWLVLVVVFPQQKTVERLFI